MSDFLRGEDDEVASFFAFQDVITAVLGILILIALQLSFSINVAHGEKGNEDSPVEGEVVPEEEYLQLQARRTALEERLNQLREQNRRLMEARRNSAGDALSQAALANAVEILRNEVNQLNRQLASLRSSVEARESEIRAQAKALGLDATQRDVERGLANLEKLERENASLSGDLQDLRDALSEAESNLSSETRKRNSIWMIPERDPDGKKPLLVTVDGSRLRFEEFDKPESLRVLNASSLTNSFESGIDPYSPRNHKIVFLFKPSGAKYFEKIIDLAKKKGFQVGYDPIEESKEVLFSFPD